MLAINYSANIFGLTFLAMMIDKSKPMYWKSFNEIIIKNRLHIDLTDYSMMGLVAVIIETSVLLLEKTKYSMPIFGGSFVVGIVAVALMIQSYLDI